jgi:hypothetical protein
MYSRDNINGIRFCYSGNTYRIGEVYFSEVKMINESFEADTWGREYPGDLQVVLDCLNTGVYEVISWPLKTTEPVKNEAYEIF